MINAPAPMSHRSFFKRTTVVLAAVAASTWLLTACSSEGKKAVSETKGITTFKATHGAGLCNLPFFLSKKRPVSDKVALEFVVAPTGADIATLFGTGEVELSVMPYTFALSLMDKGASIKTISGSGAQGLILVGAPGIKSAEDLKGKAVATAQADTLELVVYDYLVKAGLTMKDIKPKYIGTTPEMIEAFQGGSVQAVSCVEPFASQMQANVKGSTVLTDGRDLWGDGYTDCVLVASGRVISDNRDALKEVIRSMLVSQQFIEKSPDEAVKLTAEIYFKNTESVISAALKVQPSMVDQRGNAQFIIDRSQDFVDLGYITKAPAADVVFDWTMLSEVIAENGDVYSSLKWKKA